MNASRIGLWVSVFVVLARSALALSSSISAGGGAGPWALVATRDDGGRIGLWDLKGASVAGWPVAASGAWPAGTPRLQDLDGDGQPEVVCLMKSADGSRTLRAWRLDGLALPAYSPMAAPPDMDDTPQPGDVERRGIPDWVWPTRSGEVAASAIGDPMHLRPGFPVSVGVTGRLRLRLADVDGDGVPEVLGGVEAGAAGRWFVLNALNGIPAAFIQGASHPVTSPPSPAQLVPGGPPELLVSMRGRLQAYSSDGLGGYKTMPGWPVNGGPVSGGSLGLLAGPERRVLANSPEGRLAVYSADGDLLRDCPGDACLGVAVSQAQLDTLGRVVTHPGGWVLRFESDAGNDSTGRPRLFARVLGDRHHGAGTPAPVGLLPPTRLRIWINGREVPAGTLLSVVGGRLSVHAALDDPGAAGRPEIELRVMRGPSTLGSCRGRESLDLSLDLQGGTYLALATARSDTLARAEFRVESELTLENLWFYPSPMRDRGDILMDLGADAVVRAEIYTVAGRRVRVMEARFSAGHAQLAWDGRDGLGASVSNGVYFVRVQARAGDRSVESMTKLIRLN